MSVTRDGKQIERGKNHRSHVSGKRSGRFAAKIKENLDKQCERLERELRPKERDKQGEGKKHGKS